MCIETSAHSCTWSNLLSPSHGRDSSWVWHFLLISRNDSGSELRATGSCRLRQETNSLCVCVVLWHSLKASACSISPPTVCWPSWLYPKADIGIPSLNSAGWVVFWRITSNCLTLTPARRTVNLLLGKTWATRQPQIHHRNHSSF